MIIAMNPATGEELARYEFHTPAEVDATLAAAVAAQRRWAAEPVKRRTALLRRIAGVLRANRDR
jgi:succinate-semialdehyde dehydrogenase/glutarate-semialdehyde dehydrogenase